MPQNVSGSVRVSSGFTEQLSVGADTVSVPGGINWTQKYGNGTGAGNIQERWTDASTPAAGTPDTWHLRSLNQTISGGGSRTVSLAKLRSLIVENKDQTDGHVLTVTASATNGVPWLPPAGGPGIPIPAGGVFALEAPLGTALAVAAGADGIQIDPGASAGNYEIEACGE